MTRTATGSSVTSDCFTCCFPFAASWKYAPSRSRDGFVPRHVRHDGVAEAVGERAGGHLAHGVECGGDVRVVGVLLGGGGVSGASPRPSSGFERVKLDEIGAESIRQARRGRDARGRADDGRLRRAGVPGGVRVRDLEREVTLLDDVRRERRVRHAEGVVVHRRRRRRRVPARIERHASRADLTSSGASPAVPSARSRRVRRRWRGRSARVRSRGTPRRRWIRRSRLSPWSP